MYGLDYTDIVGRRAADAMGACPPWGQAMFPLSPYCPFPTPAGAPAAMQGMSAIGQATQADFGGFNAPPGWPPGPVSPLAVQQVQQGLVGLAPRWPYKIRTEWLGFPRVKIRKCETVKIECTAQVPIKPIRFVIPRNVAFGLLVEDIVIGKDHLINCDAIPAEMFDPKATDEFNPMIDTVQPGCSVAITLTNVSDDDLCVSIGCICRVVYY